MNITAVKTHKITREDASLEAILDRYLPELSEKTVVVVTSKIVSITEGRMEPIREEPEEPEETEETKDQKDRLIEQEAQYYLPRDENPYRVSLTITNDSLVATAGIDESNADGHYILWPQNPQESANKIRSHIAKSRGLRDIGVIVTDSKTTPLRWGVTAFALAYSGFEPLRDYIGEEDLFGREFKYEKLNIADSLASAVTVVMGEGSEQTPLAVITDIPFVKFVDHDPSGDELASLRIAPNEDLYAPLLNSVRWRKGKASKR